MNPLIGRPNHPTMKQRVKHGAGQYGISATRLDFLRIAISMLDDWKGNTCEGKYLKEIFKRRVSIKQRPDDWSSTHRSWGEASVINVTKSYAGQFWTDASGLEGKEILFLEGANGQIIAIDMSNSRITVVNAGKSNHVSLQKLVYEPLKYGRIR